MEIRAIDFARSAAFWLSVALVEIVTDHRSGGIHFSEVVHETLSYTYWIVLTPIIVDYVRRRPPLLNRNWVAHAVVAIAVGMGSGLYSRFTHEMVEHGGVEAGWLLGGLLTGLYAGTVYHVAIVAMTAAIQSDRTARERAIEQLQLRVELGDARAHALRMQLNPHFLFNTLNTVSSLVERDPAATRVVVARLSELLREVLAHNDALETTLQHEVEMAERYATIARIRFDNRIEFAFDIDPAARDCIVPSLLLQPLLENTVEHGTSNTTESVHVTVTALVIGSVLNIVVRDDGVSTDTVEAGGVGLTNLRARLDHLYGANGRLAHGRNHEGGYTVAIAVPARRASELAA